MRQRGCRHEQHREPRAPVEQRGRGQQTETECQHAWMKVRLERVGARAWNAMPEREGRHERKRGPGRRVHAVTDRHQSDPDQRDRQEITGEEECVERDRCGARDGGDDFVGDHQPALRIDQRAVSRKELRVDGLLDDRDVERLIGDAVAIAGAVGRGQQREEDAASRPRCRLRHRSRQAKAGGHLALTQRLPSSALGP